MSAATSAVFRELFKREIDERYRGSLLGSFWLILLPLIQLAVLSWVFGHLLGARAITGDWPYTAFLAVGLWSWNIFANAVNRSVNVYVANAGIISKVPVEPRLFLYASAVSSVVLDIVSFLLVLVVLILMGIELNATGLHWVLLSALGIIFFALALAELVALLQIFLRDTLAVVGQLLSLWFFLTPVFYQKNQLPKWVADWVAWNPITGPVEVIRDSLQGKSPELSSLWLIFVAGIIVFVFSRFLYYRVRAHMEDFL
jgi:lipopolysaccharide transport system permease protein